MRFEDWPNCPTPDCEFKVCIWAGTGRCAQCSTALLGEKEMVERYDKSHDANGRLLPYLEGVDPPEDGV